MTHPADIVLEDAVRHMKTLTEEHKLIARLVTTLRASLAVEVVAIEIINRQCELLGEKDYWKVRAENWKLRAERAEAQLREMATAKVPNEQTRKETA